MCRAEQCTTCGKTTWAGCGQHISEVMAEVPEAARCTCRGPAVPHEPSGSSGWRSRLRTLLDRG